MQIQITDCKSLSHSVIGQNPSLSENRTQIVIRSRQGPVSEDHCQWVPTDKMRAYDVTKASETLCEEFQGWLALPTVELIDERENTSVNLPLFCLRPFVNLSPSCLGPMPSAGPLPKAQLSWTSSSTYCGQRCRNF